MALSRTLPERTLACQLLRYERSTGLLYWRPRPPEMFTRHRQFLTWNKRFAGNVAGHVGERGYIKLMIFRKSFKAHRIVWLIARGEPVPHIIDHKDGDPANNRLRNLRAATHPQNLANAKLSTVNKTGVKGVHISYVTSRGVAYRASIRADGKRHDLGIFHTLEEAIEARRKAATRLHGEFNRR